jgi:hypothetical protein
MVDEFSSEQKKKFDAILAEGNEDKVTAPLVKRSHEANKSFDAILDKDILSALNKGLSGKGTNLPPVRKAASQQIGR